MEMTKGWCTWQVSWDYLVKALTQCTNNNAQHIQVVNSGDKGYPFLVIYYNPPNERTEPTQESTARKFLLEKADLTWNCHICKNERRDHLISVLTKDLIINGQVVGQENIRYCNDNNECWEGAKTFSFLKSTNKRSPNEDHSA